MCDDEREFENFDEWVRSVAREIGRSAERMAQFDVDEVAGAFGVDPAGARQWVDSAGQWLRAQFEGVAGEPRRRATDPDAAQSPAAAGTPSAGTSSAETPSAETPSAGRPPAGEPSAGRPSAGKRAPADPVDPLSHAGPHPLDVPTDEQGLALSALLSGRWAIEPGSNALAARGEGPAPSDALGIVRELRVRDWITADGEVTPVGHHALTRWLGLAGH